MRFGLIGLGFMGATHLKALKQIPGVELAMVSSADPRHLEGDLTGVGGNLSDSSGRYDFSALQRFPDSLEAARASGVDAVDICLPTALHASVAIEALRAGKHVLVEKPMALAYADAQAMMEAAAKSGKILMAAQVLRFFPAYVPLIGAVRSGRFGAVHHALFRRRCAAPGWGGWLANKAVSGGGVFDLLVHDIDMMVHLFGTPARVRAWGTESLAKGIDMITAQFDYDSGTAVTMTGGWHLPGAYPFSMEYTVVGEQGVMEYSSAGREPKWYPAGGAETPLVLPEKDGYQAEIEYFVECCRTNSPPTECTPESSAEAVRIARLAEEARNKKGEAVSCKL